MRREQPARDGAHVPQQLDVVEVSPPYDQAEITALLLDMGASAAATTKARLGAPPSPPPLAAGRISHSEQAHAPVVHNVMTV